MTTFKKGKGFLVLAQNSSNVDYIRQARTLARSIHTSQSTSIGISVVADKNVPAGEEFDYVIKLPEDDAKHETWKIHNKWRLWELSPYEKTIWLDSDMVVTVDITGWWARLDGIPIRFCTKPVDFQGKAIRREVYRQLWVQHKLPMVYTALVYFDRSVEAKRVFDTAKTIFKDWSKISKEYKFEKKGVTGDLAFSLAVKILGYFQAVPEEDDFFSFVHMKPKAFCIPNCIGKEWANSLEIIFDRNIWIDGNLQKFPLHYVDKNLVRFFEENLCRCKHI